MCVFVTAALQHFLLPIIHSLYHTAVVILHPSEPPKDLLSLFGKLGVVGMRTHRLAPVNECLRVSQELL